jgi:hypothetical protein
MARTFVFLLKDDPATKLDQIRAASAQVGIVFHGDLREGWFSGGIPGTGLDTRGIYRIVGNRITIIIDQKPYLYTWEQIEAMLSGFIEG